jgi:hypothetical protein
MSSTTYLRRRAAAEYLREQRGIPCSEKTLAKLACIGGGPLYRRFGRIPLYLIADLDAYAKAKISKPVQSTSEYEDRQWSEQRAEPDTQSSVKNH